MIVPKGDFVIEKKKKMERNKKGTFVKAGKQTY